VFEEGLEEVVDLEAGGARQGVGALGHQLVEEPVGLAFVLLALDELLLEALAALAELDVPPAVVLAEERFLRHLRTLRTRDTKEAPGEPKGSLWQPPGLALPGAAAIICCKTADSGPKKAAARFDATLGCLAPCG
jgi:hypothetical protein